MGLLRRRPTARPRFGTRRSPPARRPACTRRSRRIAIRPRNPQSTCSAQGTPRRGKGRARSLVSYHPAPSTFRRRCNKETLKASTSRFGCKGTAVGNCRRCRTRLDKCVKVHHRYTDCTRAFRRYFPRRVERTCRLSLVHCTGRIRPRRRCRSRPRPCRSRWRSHSHGRSAFHRRPGTRPTRSRSTRPHRYRDRCRCERGCRFPGSRRRSHKRRRKECHSRSRRGNISRRSHRERHKSRRVVRSKGCASPRGTRRRRRSDRSASTPAASIRLTPWRVRSSYHRHSLRQGGGVKPRARCRRTRPMHRREHLRASMRFGS